MQRPKQLPCIAAALPGVVQSVYTIRLLFASHQPHHKASFHLCPQAFADALDGGVVDGVLWAVSRIKQAHFDGLALPPGLLLQPWVAQKAVLAHAAVRAFISHGGIESCQEAMEVALTMIIV